MSESEVLYYFFHNCVGSEFISYVNKEFGDWMFIHQIKRSAALDLVVHLLILIFFEVNILKYINDISEKGYLSMKKKIFPIIALLLVIINFVPVVPVQAASDGINRFVTSNILNEVDPALLTYSSPSFSYSESGYAFDMDKFNDFSNLPVNPLDDGIIYVLAGNPTSTIYITMFDFSDFSGQFKSYLLYRNTNVQLCVRTSRASENRPSFTGYTWAYNCTTNVWYQAYGSSQFTFTQQSNYGIVDVGGGEYDYVEISNIGDNSYGYFWYTGTPMSTILGSNVDAFYSFYQFSAVGNTIKSGVADRFALSLFNGNVGSNIVGMDNYLSFGYFNGTSNVYPGDDSGTLESNSNHMYFKDCEIGFCEPYRVTNFVPFGGAYFYVKYNVDDWILNNINDYRLRFSSTAYVGSRQINGSIDVPLDPDGCITIPFSSIFNNTGLLSEGLTFAISNKVVDTSFYKTYLYSVSADYIPQFVNKIDSNHNNNSVLDAWSDLANLGSSIADYLVGSVKSSNDFSDTLWWISSDISNVPSTIESYKNYKIHGHAALISGSDSSGNVSRLFDLYIGSNTLTDSQGLSNDNPYINDTDDPNYIPDVPSDNNNMIPYSGGNTTNQINQVVNVPNNFTVQYKDGVNEFIEWYNQDPEVTGIQNTFWGALGIFKGNPANELYGDMWGFLPGGFKSVIIGCASLGIIGAAATILRKRMLR